MPQIGKAYIEVHADLSKFPAELRAQLKKAFTEGVTGVNLDGLVDKAEKAGEEAAKKAGDSFERTGKTTLKRAAENAGKEVSRSFFGSIRATFSRQGRAGGGGLFTGAIKGLFGGIKDAVATGVQGLQAAGGQVTGALGSLLGGGGDIASGIKIVAILAAIPAVLGLAGALVHLSGILLTLPALFGFVVAAIAPLIVAFEGVGGALSAGLAGDTEKFREALKGLAEPAQKVVKEFVGLKGIFSAIKKDVQTAFFAPLIGQVKLLGTTLFPVLQAGLTHVADSLGRFFGGFLELLRAPDILDDILDLFKSTGRIIDNLAPTLLRLFGTLFGVMEHGLPFVERLFAALGRGLDRFAGFLSGAMKSGDFERFLENAFAIGKELVGILEELGHLIGSLFGGQDFAEGSKGFLRDIKLAIKALANFFDSAEGQEVIEGLLSLIKGLGLALIGLAIFIGKAAYWSKQFADAVEGAVIWTLEFLQAIGGGFVSALRAIGDFFAMIGSAIATFFTEMIPNAFETVVEFFQSLPGRLLELLRTVFLAVVDFVTEQIGRLIGIILSLPFLISQLPSKVAAVFDLVVAFLFSLPGRAAEALSSLWATVSGFFSSIWNDARDLTKSAIESISNFVGSLPGRVAAIGPALLNAAKSLGRKIGDGLGEIGNFASDIGKRIVGTIKSGINYIIDGINRGIADIDDRLPIGLPRLPKFERGGIIDSPTVALLGEKNKREVVLPLTDPGRANQLAEQSGLTKILSRGAAAPTINLTAVLDGFGVIRVVRMVVDDALDNQGAELAFGSRT